MGVHCGRRRSPLCRDDKESELRSGQSETGQSELRSGRSETGAILTSLGAILQNWRPTERSEVITRLLAAHRAQRGNRPVSDWRLVTGDLLRDFNVSPRLYHRRS